MGNWLTRLFGQKDEPAQVAIAPAEGATSPDGTPVPPERMGLDGHYDQSGLAKRVAAAFDQNGVEDAPHLYVAQTGTTVVFKGNVKSQEILDHLAQIAAGVNGAEAVDTSEVKIA
jgi:osmotically-inducible protein OsmY